MEEGSERWHEPVVLFTVADGTQSYQVVQGIVSKIAARSLMMDVQVVRGAAELATPPISF
jgi:hypothetical protein